jgi:hypothetical protein
MNDLPISKKTASIIVTAFVALVLSVMTAGINDNGERTVVQWPNGTTFVKFEPGLYWSLFGSTWSYPDVLTEDFDGGQDSAMPIAVRYQDGGQGHVKGIARINLPNDPETMLKVHKEFRSAEGIRAKIFRPGLKEAANLTAGLMTSEEAYTERRADFARWAQDQFEDGTYVTKLEQQEEQVEAAIYDAKDPTKLVQAAKTRTKNVPVIAMDPETMQPMHNIPDIVQYGLTVSGFAINDWSFEQRTLDQIQAKREAEMAIITSRAQAEKAKQQEQQAVAEGLRNVATAKYEKEVEKERAVVDAEREKEVAVIAAAKAVAVNEQNYLAGVQDVKAAGEYAQAVKLRTTADADARKRMIEADGALAQKLEAYVEVNKEYAAKFGQQKWVPELTMGDSADGSTGSAATDMITLLTAKTAKDLSLDMTIIE